MVDIDTSLLGKRRLTIVYGAEAAECALACLAMISRYHGRDVDLNALRLRFPTSMAGIGLRGLMDIADRMGLAGRALRVDLPDLGHIRCPAILHWDLNHFVVLSRIVRNRAFIHDPRYGIRAYSLPELSAHFTGVALELTPSAPIEAMPQSRSTKMSDLWSGISGAWGAALHVLILSVALLFLAFAAPFQLQLAIDEGIYRADKQILTSLALFFGVAVVVQYAITALRDWTLQSYSNLFGFQIVGNILRHLIRLPVEYFEKRHVGDLLSRLRSAETIRNTLTQGVLAAVLDGTMALIAALLLAVYSPLLFFIVAVGLGLNILVVTVTYPFIRSRSVDQIMKAAREQSFLMESIRAIRTIKTMGREVERENGWRNLFVDTINSSLSRARWETASNALVGMTTALQAVLVIYVGARMVISGEGFTIGMLVAFLSFRQTLSDRVFALTTQWVQFRLLDLHLERLGDIVQAQAETATSHLDELSEVKGAVRLRGISFRYGVTDPAVFEHIDLDIAAGEFVAITGRSGCGKTTLLKVLLGLYLPSGGEIYLDDYRSTPGRLRSWRSRVGLVEQEDRLLSGTIAENITFFDPQIDMAMVIAAAREARIHAEIERMPMGYLSLVGDMGSALSGGQRQRLLFARALYRRPKVLIIDEGTANLDLDTERLIAKTIAAIDVTRIVVAHRPALLRLADRIYVLEPQKGLRLYRSFEEYMISTGEVDAELW